MITPSEFIDRTLLITGGTGSFGNAVLSRVLDFGLKEIRIFSRDEKKQEDMRLRIKNPLVKFIIGDIRNFDSVSDAAKGADFIFHAAALKQVPSCEFYPMEAVRTNVLGTENLLRASVQQGVKRVVVLSTDKAVYPINAMGISKAMMEKVMQAQARIHADSGTVMCATRYGNVMGSRGSVIPLFLSQIASGADVTITDPTMTRFMMSLEDSVDLVLHAFKASQPGDIFVQKAPGASVGLLADVLMNLKGGPSKRRVIGTRHGEKLFETLVSREEMARAEDQGGYFRIPADGRDLNYDQYFVHGNPRLPSYEDYTSHSTEQLSADELITLLRRSSLV